MGISMMIVAFFTPEEAELWLMIIAALLVISGHVLNKHLLKQHQLLVTN
jgi:hypothetical protein